MLLGCLEEYFAWSIKHFLFITQRTVLPGQIRSQNLSDTSDIKSVLLGWGGGRGGRNRRWCYLNTQIFLLNVLLFPLHDTIRFIRAKFQFFNCSGSLPGDETGSDFY
jgi:hypothetical protein